MTTPPRDLPAASDRVELVVEDGERWWGGAAEDGRHMPFGDRDFTRDLGAPHGHGTDAAAPSGQSSPLLLSTHGRVVWSERPFTFAFDDDRRLTVTGTDVVVLRAGGSLREAFLAASARFFPASGRTPAPELFTGPQYNSWIELPYRPTQESVLRYVRGLLDAGMPPGVVIVDDNWAPDYGTWRFDGERFPDPAGMVAQLSAWGCRVVLWLVPFVSPDSATFRELESRRLVLRDATGRTAVRRWWNGLSAVLDVSDPDAVAWLTDRLDALVAGTGIAGFKFDGGDLRDFRADDDTAGSAQPVDMCEAWARMGLRYPFNEYRACWRLGGQPLGQRLQDKPPRWDAQGIGSLVPELLAQGLIGHAFTCPDMVGGGEITAMTDQGDVDQEFFVRYAQVAALSPMIQFSVSPARVLDAEHLAAVHEALAVRASVMPLLLDLVAHAARTGEPVVRPMAYHADGCDDVTDQFFLGPDLVVAPVLERGATGRRVVLPDGEWLAADTGETVRGPATVTVPCDLRTIPRFSRVPAAPAAG